MMAPWTQDRAVWVRGDISLYSCEINSLSPYRRMVSLTFLFLLCFFVYYIKQIDSMLRKLLFSSLAHRRNQNVVRTLVTSPRLFFAGGGACSCAFIRQM